jgi:hypothetical protein
MSKLGLALILAAGLSLSAAPYSYAQDAPAKSAKQLGHLSRAKHQKVCTYKCPPKLHVCPGDFDDATGCYYYTCTTGIIGSNSCP